jgi:hypothetical protein
MYPEVQAKAQTEVDKVTGGSRLPKSSDRAQLPYIVAVCKEVSQLAGLSYLIILIFCLASQMDDNYTFGKIWVIREKSYLD